MGAKPSSISDLQHNAVLQKFIGEVSIGETDEFWDQLLEFSFQPPTNCADSRLLEEATEPVCQKLTKNNLRTGNFVTLIRVFLRKVAELKDSTKDENSEAVLEVYNAALLIRSFIKYFLTVLKSEEVIKQFGGSLEHLQTDEVTIQVTCKDSGSTEDIICGLIDVLVDLQVGGSLYGVHVESINTLLVILSVQMFDPYASSNNIFFHTIMRGKCKNRANELVQVLLKNFIKHDQTPAEFIHHTTGWISSIWAWLGSGHPDESHTESLLANQSLLLLLVLVNHCTQDKTQLNPYRQALFTFTQRQGTRGNMEETEQPFDQHVFPSFTLNLGMLYDAICRELNKDQTTLLLYLLLHRNPDVAGFILSRADIDNLVIPILKLLYRAEEHNSHHIYMSLIILLILSQDENFNKSVHELAVSDISWYTERVISNITLGGLLVLVVLRTIQYNMTKMRDKYLHTNCLATLANMSSQFHALHPYVTQRIVSLYALLSKKHAKVMENIRQAEEHPNDSDETQTGEHMSDLAILEEVIRMVLEIVNSCVTNTLHHNPNLVYTLLHRRELFAQFRTHPTFHDIIQNIDTVLSFFSARLEQHPDQTLSVGVVLDVIKQGTLQWPKDRLKKFPELKFKYVEEEQPEEFFIPYVWSLVYKSSHLYWNPDNIQIFHPDA